MCRKILIIGLVLFITSCQSYKTVYDNRINTETEKEIIKRKIKGTWFIFFNVNYLNSKIKCIQNNKTVWKDNNVTTDETLGIASSFSVYNKEKITIYIDSFKISVNYNKDYPYVYVQKNKNKFTITYSKYFIFPR